MTARRSAEEVVDLVQALLALPRETEWLEDKHNNADPAMVGEEISALANSATLAQVDHGYLIWGVQDGTRAVVGTSFKPFEIKVGNEDFKHWLTRLLSPQVHFTFHEVTVDGCPMVLLEVHRAGPHPVKFKGQSYIRIGSYKKSLKDYPETERQLWRALDQASFEDGIAAPQVGTADVLTLLDYPAYFELMNIPLPESRQGILDALHADNMVRAEGTHWSVTNLGAILFAKRLEEFPSLSRKSVRVIQYRGRGRVETIKEQLGTLGYANGFSGLISYITGLLPSNEVIGEALRRTVRMYPDLAIRELVANALTHQDFSLSGTGPMVEVFDDRIEITNPGTPLVDPLRFVDSPPRSRNERLAAVMRRVGICEERGSGWDKVGFQIELYQLPAPLIDVTADHTRVTLFSYRDLRNMDRADRVRAVYLHACLRHVNHEKVTNTSVRERFKIESHNSARASRLIKDAVEDRMIVPRDPHAARKLMEYVPWWAAPDLGRR